MSDFNDGTNATGVANSHPYRIPVIVAIGGLLFLFFASDCFKYCV